MCTKEKVYKRVFSVGIYAWIIFEDDDEDTTVFVSARFPKRMWIPFVYFGLFDLA